MHSVHDHRRPIISRTRGINDARRKRRNRECDGD
jgi:hypothetical protein